MLLNILLMTEMVAKKLLMAEHIEIYNLLCISATGAQPISLKLLKGLGCCPARFCEMSAEQEFHKNARVGTVVHCLLTPTIS